MTMNLARDNFVICLGLLGAFGLVGCEVGIAISAPSETATSHGPVNYTVSYTDANTVTLSIADVSLNKTGAARGVVAISGAGSDSRTVTISDIAGDGTLGITIAKGTATDELGNTAPATQPSANFTVDNTPPGIEVSEPSMSHTRDKPVGYRVSITGASNAALKKENVTLNMTDTAEGDVSVHMTDSASYRVVISSTTGDGTLGITIAEGVATDDVGNLSPETEPSATFIVDNTLPRIIVFEPSVSQTRGGPVDYAVVSRHAYEVTLTEENVKLNRTGTAFGAVSVVHPPNHGTCRVVISDTTGDGTLGITIAEGVATDPAGNLSPETDPSATFIVDNTGPSIAIGPPSIEDGEEGSVAYIVNYAGAQYVALDKRDIILEKTGTAKGTVSVDGMGNDERTVKITDTIGIGSLGISIAADSAVDALGNMALGAGPSAVFNVYKLYFSETYVLPGDVPLVLISIPAGTFDMGSKIGYSDEIPVHAVTVSQPFLLGRTEVTKAQWESIMNTTPWMGRDRVLDDPDSPAVYVSWHDARAFAAELNAFTGETFRLPTEAEWEYACRGGTTTEYFFGNNAESLSDHAWWEENAGSVAQNFGHVVAQLRPNAYGLFDMLGNVYEWCEDWHGGDYYSVSPGVDPTGPTSGSARMARGADTDSPAFFYRSASRGNFSPSLVESTHGFRLVRINRTETFSLGVHGEVPLAMVNIPAGTFEMGSTYGDEDEAPVHALTLSKSFQLGQTEVTKAQWYAVMGTAPWTEHYDGPNHQDSPAVDISWYDAQDFITTLNGLTGETFRLPTEAEWEYACRAGSSTEYHFGDDSTDLSLYAWWFGNAHLASRQTVGQLLPNAFGLFDMSGNVWEMCEDWYSSTYYSVSPSTDPSGPTDGSHRVARGGSWRTYAPLCRSAFRTTVLLTDSSSSFGFRLAR